MISCEVCLNVVNYLEFPKTLCDTETELEKGNLFKTDKIKFNFVMNNDPAQYLWNCNLFLNYFRRFGFCTKLCIVKTFFHQSIPYHGGFAKLMIWKDFSANRFHVSLGLHQQKFDLGAAKVSEFKRLSYT